MNKVKIYRGEVMQGKVTRYIMIESQRVEDIFKQFLGKNIKVTIEEIDPENTG